MTINLLLWLNFNDTHGYFTTVGRISGKGGKIEEMLHLKWSKQFHDQEEQYFDCWRKLKKYEIHYKF